ncbi:MAG TPA: hypothetical protein VJA16_13805 [Thermoanaerobaculia bacterium]
MSAASCATPTFTFSKLIERPDPADTKGAGLLHVVLNVKADYEGTMNVTIWQGPTAPPAGACANVEKCFPGAVRLFPLDPTQVKACQPDNDQPECGTKMSVGKNGKDNSIVFSKDFYLKNVLRHPKVLIHYATDPDPDNTGCSKGIDGYAVASLADLHSFEIDAGSVFVYQKKSSSSSGTSTGGNFKGQPEAAFVETDRWARDVTSYTDIRYSYVGAVASSTNMANGMPPQQSRAPGASKANSSSSSSSSSNPFQSGAGTLRTNVYFALFGSEFKERPANISWIAGGGITTIPDSSSVHSPTRGFTGIRVDIGDLNTAQDAAHFGGSSGYFQVGYAYDNFWAFDKAPSSVAGAPGIPGQRHRIFIEGQVRFPNSTLSISPRFFVDLPASGSGDSDIRISALATIDATKLGSWFSSVTGSGSKQ